jgi:hypothetical protein
MVLVMVRRRHTFGLIRSTMPRFRPLRCVTAFPESEQLRRAIALWIADRGGLNVEVKPVKAALYARVSTAEQNPENQLEEVRRS